VTNKQTRVNTNSNNLRNIIALQDLGEGQLSGIADNEVVLDPSTGIFNSLSILLQIMQIMITIRHK
jgi:hypothetical protein